MARSSAASAVRWPAQDPRECIAAGVGAGPDVAPARTQQRGAHQAPTDERGLEGVLLARVVRDRLLGGTADRPGRAALERVAGHQVAAAPAAAPARCAALEELHRGLQEGRIGLHGLKPYDKEFRT